VAEPDTAAASDVRKLIISPVGLTLLCELSQVHSTERLLAVDRYNRLSAHQGRAGYDYE